MLRVVIWGLPFQAANHVLNRTLIAADRERVFVLIGGGALVMNVLLNAVLIPRYGYYGAGAATVYTLAQSMVLHLWNVRRTAYRHPLRRALLGPVAAMVVAWGAVGGLGGLVLTEWGMGITRLPVQAWGPLLAATAGPEVLSSPRRIENC